MFKPTYLRHRPQLFIASLNALSDLSFLVKYMSRKKPRKRSKKSKRKNNNALKVWRQFLQFLRTLSAKVSHLPKRIWLILPTLALIMGIIFNLTLDLPEFISRLFSSFEREPVASDIQFPFESADLAGGEVLVIVTSFSGADGETSSIRIFRALSERSQLKKLENVRIEFLADHSPVLSSDAVTIGEKADATIVIWGTADQYGIEPNYEIVRNSELVESIPDLGITISLDLPSYNAYVVKDVPSEFEFLILFTLGQISYFSGDYSESISTFDNTLSIDLKERGPDLSLGALYQYRGLANAKLGNFLEAIADLDQAVIIDPVNPHFYLARGVFHLQQYERNEALDDFSTALELDPNFYSAYLNRGAINFQLGRFEDALIDFESALEIEPNSWAALSNLGTINTNLGHYELAIDSFTSALNFELNPLEMSTVYHSRALAYFNNGDINNALHDIDTAMRLDPLNFPALTSRGDILREIGEYESAIETLGNAIHLEPDYAIVYTQRGRTYYDMGLLDMAMDDFDKAIELLQRDPRPYYYRGLINIGYGNNEAAIFDFSYSIELKPDNLLAYIHRGHLYELQENYQLAIDDYNHVLESDPGYTSVYFDRGTAFYNIHEFEAAISDLNLAIELNPPDHEAYTWRGLSYYYLDNNNAAIADFESSITLNPDFAVSYLGIALIADERGDVDIAIENYTQFLSLYDNIDELSQHAISRLELLE